MSNFYAEIIDKPLLISGNGESERLTFKRLGSGTHLIYINFTEKIN